MVILHSSAVNAITIAGAERSSRETRHYRFVTLRLVL
jgi:hypothetical protein